MSGNLWLDLWVGVEKNEQETLANNISLFNVERLRERLTPSCADDDER